MPVVLVLTASGDAALPGVPLDGLGAFTSFLLSVAPVRHWVVQAQAQGWHVTVCGQGDRIPEGCQSLDVPLTDSEYARFVQATEEKTSG